MANINKIRKYNLEDEVIQLHNSGLSLHDIEKALRKAHPDIPDIQNISFMSIKRFIDSYKEETTEAMIEAGDDPTGKLIAEFRQKMSDLDDETREIYIIMKKALKNIIATGDDYKVIRAAKDTLRALEQRKNNWTALIQWGVNELRPIEKAKEVNFVQVNNLLVNMSKELCPKCRAKVVGLVLEEENQDART